MGNKVLLSTKHFYVTGDRKLVRYFVRPFFQWVGLLAYQLSLGTHYSQVYPIFYISLLKPFHAGGDGYPIQQLCIFKTSKNRKPLEYFGTKDQVQKRSI